MVSGERERRQCGYLTGTCADTLASFAYAFKKRSEGGTAMADGLAMKLLIAGVIGAIVGAAAADRYHFPAASVYGFNKQSGGGPSRPPASPMVDSARAGEARADDSIGRPRIMRSASPVGLEAGPSGPPQWRGSHDGYGRAAMGWRECEDPDFGIHG